MLQKTKNFTRRILGASELELTPEDVQAARHYISVYWSKLKRSHPVDDENMIGLPYPYLVPAHEEGHEFDFNELYYWDSYFIVQGLLDLDHQELVLGILEDLLSLQKRFRIIPNASRTYLMGRSQPPLLTSFIFDCFEAFGLSKSWLARTMDVAKDEYFTVWMGSAKPNWRRVYRDLSRYFDVNMLHNLAETESGWDMTTRFNHSCLNYLPIDLNAYLYKYETDFARAAELVGEVQEARTWQEKAEDRRLVVDDLMWSKSRKFFFDYNYVKERRGVTWSLAAYVPMWAGMVSQKQASLLVKGLKKFEYRGGLATTDNQTLSQYVPGAVPTQWAYPNGWAPLHFLVVKGLERYGYKVEARRIALKWLRTNLRWFHQNGQFLEKYNVVQPERPPVKGLYPTQTGFGWTNAVFERFCRDNIDSSNDSSLIS